MAVAAWAARLAAAAALAVADSLAALVALTGLAVEVAMEAAPAAVRVAEVGWVAVAEDLVVVVVAAVKAVGS